MTDINPFDVFDDQRGLPRADTLTPGPRPSLGERFQANKRESFRNTVSGAVLLASNSGGTEDDATVDGYKAWATKWQAYYDAMPQWEGTLEGAVSLAGQIAGGLPSPENFIPIGVGGKVVGMVGLKASGLGARVLAGATDAAIGNVVADPVVQGLQIAGGSRDAYDPMQTALAAPVGALIGGGVPAVGAAAGRLVRTFVGETAAKIDAPAAREISAASNEAAKGSPAAPTDRATPEATPTDRMAPDQTVTDPVAADAVAAPVAKPQAGETPPADAPAPAKAETPPVEPRTAPLPEPTPERPDVVRAAAEDAVGPDATIGEKLAAEAAIREGRKPPVDGAASSGKTAAKVSGGPDALAMRAGPLSGEQKRAAGGVAETATDKAPEAAPSFVRLKDAADALVEAIDPAAVRQGRIPPSMAGAEGIYTPATAVVRVKNTQDFQVLTHELGHHLEQKIGAPIRAWMATNEARLRPMAYEGAALDAIVKEGFAETARLFVTNPAFLEKQQPGLAADLEAAVRRSDPMLADAMIAAREAYAGWLAQPSARAVASTIVPAKRPGWAEKARDALGDVKGTLAEFFSSAYTALLDDLHPISRTVDALTALYKANNDGARLDLDAARDPYKLARMARGAYTAGHADISFGVTPYHGTEPVSGGLRDALIEAQGGGNLFSRVREDVLADFGSYLWSRRARGEFDRFAAGEIPNPPDKLTRGDHEVNIKELEAKHPAFAAAAEKVYAWNRALWDKKRDAGLITGEQHADGLKIADYVPGLRHFDDAEAKVPTRGAGRSGKGAMVRRFQGSDRDVVNPIDSLVADAYQTAMAIARNDAVKALGRLADLAGPGSGRFVERVPAKEIRATLIGGEEAVGQLAKEAGLAGADIASFRDEVTDLLGGTLPEGFKVFKMGQINEKGEAIVWYREGGQLMPLRLADGAEGARMMAALDAMTRDEKAFLLEILAKPAAVLRLGVTTHPTFLVANIARDQMVSAILFGKPFERLGLSMKGFVDDLMGREAARSYMRVGGLSAGANTATLNEARVGRDTIAATMSGTAARVTTFKGLIEATETAETASRLGNFGVFFRAAKERGLNDWEASFEAAYRARDVLDFDRRGSKTMAISRIIPFLNASVQGLDKAGRELFVPVARRLAGEMLTVEDERQLANSIAAWGRLGMVTVASMGLWALVSQHPGADDLDARVRATHWVVPMSNGQWAVIPKPFELAAVINVGEALWDGWAKSDPTAANRYLHGLFDVLMPPSLLDGNPLLKAAYELKANMNFFTDRPIVPDHMKALEPFLQYNHNTSTLAKRLGEAANISPLKIDHVITGFGGSWGRSLLAMSDWASSEKPATGWAEAIFTRRFIKDASRGSTSVGAFWDLVSQRTGTLETALRSYRALMDEGRIGEASAFAGRQDDDTRAYLAAQLVPGKRGEPAAALHPLVRARSAVLAIGGLMRDLADDRIETADGYARVGAVDRRRAQDVLSDLKMAEARNAMIQVGAKGFSSRPAIPTDGYLEELVAISPDVAQALADRYRTARVLRKDAVEAAWPELRRRLLAEGTDAETRDLTASAWGAGFELDGRRIKKHGKPAMPVQQ